jgi:putative membrane protein
LRVSEGTRTPDRLDHNQELYQLSYAHRGAPESTSARPLFGVRVDDGCRRRSLLAMSSESQSRRSDPGLGVRLLISWLTNAIVLAVVAWLLSGVHVSNFGALLVAAAVFGVLNTLLKPLLRVITLPFAILTLGIAWFFVSLLMLVLTDHIASGFSIHGFWTYVEATMIVWLVNLALDFLPGPWQITGHRRRRKAV